MRVLSLLVPITFCLEITEGRLTSSALLIFGTVLAATATSTPWPTSTLLSHQSWGGSAAVGICSAQGGTIT